MKLSKKQQQFWVVLVAVATVALILTSMIPLLSALLR